MAIAINRLYFDAFTQYFCYNALIVHKYGMFGHNSFSLTCSMYNIDLLPCSRRPKNVSIKLGNNIAGSILVLDDDFDINMLIKISLQKIGYDVFGFTNPVLALEHFRMNHQTYSLVISDIRIPIMNGFEFARNISRIKPEVKIIFMTAFDVNDDLLVMNAKCNSNVIGIIQKPISPGKNGKDSV